MDDARYLATLLEAMSSATARGQHTALVSDTQQWLDSLDFNADLDAMRLEMAWRIEILAPIDGVLTSLVPCDFNGDASCDVFDMNQLFTQVDLVAGVPSDLNSEKFDLTGDNTINQSDISRWLSAAATHNGYGSLSRRGDSDGLGGIFPDTRDVDVTDFNALATNFNPTGDGDPTNGPFWHEGNFDGDDVDITDFNFLAINFAPTGYGATSAVPEPSTLVLLFLGSTATGIFFRRKRL